MMMRLSEAAHAMRGALTGSDGAFVAVTTDSRKAQAGDLFVALKGEHVDGHDYVADCLRRGAAGAVVSQWVAHAGSQIQVADPRLALGELAACWRSRFTIPLAAVTGSNGKTTVKEMLAAILRAASTPAAVLATEGNLNNDIGLPLTLLKLQPQHRYAVVEMGMNHAGEIAYLTRIAQPSVAVVNNAAAAHLEGLGSVQAVARAKGEIFQGLAADGVAVINADDAHAALWRQLAASKRIMSFGLEHPADVSADYQLQPDGSELTINAAQGRFAVHLGTPGLHNIRNALAATAAALAMGIAPAAIAVGLERFDGVKGRLQTKLGRNGARVIDDSYNANPASVKAAIDMLSGIKVNTMTIGKPTRWLALALGDMGELGTNAAQLHAEAGRYAKACGIDALYALGELSREAVAAFGKGAWHFDAPDALAAAVLPALRPGVTLLVKGSRFMRMERVVDLLTEPLPQETLHVA